MLLARSVLTDLEREMSAIEGALRVLATAEEVGQGDLRSFQQRASAAIAAGIVINSVLTDAMARQRMNTLLPFRSRLPESGTPPRLLGACRAADAALYAAKAAGKNRCVEA